MKKRVGPSSRLSSNYSLPLARCRYTGASVVTFYDEFHSNGDEFSSTARFANMRGHRRVHQGRQCVRLRITEHDTPGVHRFSQLAGLPAQALSECSRREEMGGDRHSRLFPDLRSDRQSPVGHHHVPSVTAWTLVVLLPRLSGHRRHLYSVHGLSTVPLRNHLQQPSAAALALSLPTIVLHSAPVHLYVGLAYRGGDLRTVYGRSIPVPIHPHLPSTRGIHDLVDPPTLLLGLHGALLRHHGSAPDPSTI